MQNRSNKIEALIAKLTGLTKDSQIEWEKLSNYSNVEENDELIDFNKNSLLTESQIPPSSKIKVVDKKSYVAKINNGIISIITFDIIDNLDILKVKTNMNRKYILLMQKDALSSAIVLNNSTQNQKELAALIAMIDSINNDVADLIDDILKM